MKSNFVSCCQSIATLGPIGKRLPAPGTFGSLAGLVVAAGLVQLPLLAQMFFLLALIFGAIFVSQVHATATQTHDHQSVIIDEVAGQCLALMAMPFEWKYFALGFLLFRFFDILKPWPISWMDRNIKGGAGIVLDDVAAGLVAQIILQIILQRFPL